MRLRIPIKSTILVKGLAFILVPCAIDTIFCVQLLNLVSASNEMARQEHRHMEIVRHANSILTLYGAASGQLGTYASIGDKEALARAHEYEQKMNLEFEQLMPLLKTLPNNIAQSTVEYRRQGADMLDQMERMGSNAGSEDLTTTFLKLKEKGLMKFITKAGTTSRTITDLAMAQEAEIDKARLQQVESREKVTNGLRLLIGFNLLLALIMGCIFLFDITRRLSILMQNAQLLPKLLPLNENVGGNDELSYLDSILHSAAAELRTASEQRRYLMEMVAHDIRSPLMSSQLSIEMLSDTRMGELPPQAKRQVSALSQNLHRVISLTSDLMEVDKLESGVIEITPELLDIADLVEENIRGLAELAKKRNLTLISECGSAAIMADRLRMGQVITNIITNAIKFSPEGQWIKVVTTRNESYLTISIIDNGPGIPKKQQQRIFEKYAQLDNGRGKGFGLGLAICKLIVDAHDGAIGVTNEPGAGARFWIRLPLAQETDGD